MSQSERLALNGGQPTRNENDRPWPQWPIRSMEEWTQRIEPALREVYLSGVEGLPEPRSEAFGHRLAEFCGAKYGRMLVHGTDAIAAALAAALDLDAWGPGGEVILPNYTFIASASAAIDRRCTLAFVDIDPTTFTIDPEAAEAAVRPGITRAIMPVHLAGHPADMGAINAIAAKYNLVVVEDCAQAHAAEYDRRRVGSIGHVGAFSFQSTKNLTSGEGGAVITNDPEIDARVVAFMNVGRHPTGGRWEYPRLGWNYRPSEYLAALLTVRLADLEAQTLHREKMAGYLSRRLAEIPGVVPPRTAPWCTRHAYHLYAALVDPAQFGHAPRKHIVDALTAEGVPAMEGYTTPLSEQPALQYLREKHPEAIRVLPCPNTQYACDHSVWFAQSMLLGDTRDMDDIARAFAKVQRILAGQASARQAS